MAKLTLTFSRMFMAEKLNCIMSCCQVINNLLLDVSMSNEQPLSGADDILPILIYITIG
uniref:VPS9 domain-containing protein n=1 Tax=Oryza rufipogon TaxID=4529 RepID=A0A0E0MV57_ORYRU